jgi:hypothetical protein
MLPNPESAMTDLPVSAARRARIPWPVFAGAAFVFLFSAAYNYFVFDHTPHIHDEISYLFQARVLLSGHFTAASPPARASFDFPHTINNGRWYSMYPPGWPYLLALGVLIRAPWLINPLLGGLTIFLLYFLGVEIYGRRTGILAAMLGSISIWLVLMSSTMMSHPASMFFNGIFLLFFFRSLKRPTIMNGLAAGLGFGIAYLVRPYNALVFSLPFLLVVAYRLLREFKTRWKNALAMIVPAALCGGFFLFYNAMTTGRAFTPGYIVYHGPQYATIFGRPATLDYDFTPLVGAIQMGANMAAINDFLFGWPLTSLWLLLFVVWAARVRPKERGPDLLLFCGFLSMIVGFFFFWGSFVIIGARMLFDSLPVLVLLNARGWERAPALLAGRFRRIGPSAWARGLAAVLALFTVYAFAVRFPRWTHPAGHGWYYERYDRNICGSTAWIDHAVRAAGLHRAVVVLKFVYGPLSGFPTGWWSSGFAFDTPALDGDIIYANDRGEAQNLALLRGYPDRSVYLYTGTLEGGVLAPLREEGGAVRTGDPIVPAQTPRRAVALLSGLEELFTMYAPEFRTFIEGAVRSEGLFGLTVDRLTEIGLAAVKAGRYAEAAFAFEAALQIEKNPRIRWPLLMDLAPCYIKTGRVALARRILDKFGDSDFLGMGLFNVLPERGF